MVYVCSFIQAMQMLIWVLYEVTGKNQAITYKEKFCPVQV